MTASLPDYEWLTSAAAVPYLQRCAQHTGELTRLLGSLRKELSAERAHLVVDQAELRVRGREKFRRASEMFFTRKGLEQASDEQIAGYKASRLPTQCAPAIDLCCGIGGDLTALASWSQAMGSAVGVDSDPCIAHLADTNAARLGAPASVLVQDALQTELEGFGVVHIDPDRRADGARHTRWEDLTPGPAFLANHRSRNLAIKLAPATDVPDDWTADAEREWIGSRGECRQQMLWTNALVRQPGRRTATVLSTAQVRTVVEQPDAPLEATLYPQRYLHEPHAAVLAAQVTASLASEHRLVALTPEGGYLTGDSPIDDLALASFEVLDVLTFDVKQLKNYLRQRGVGRLEIKKRGVDVTPEKLRSQLALQGDANSTLVLTRVAGRTLAMVVRRL